MDLSDNGPQNRQQRRVMAFEVFPWLWHVLGTNFTVDGTTQVLYAYARGLPRLLRATPRTRHDTAVWLYIVWPDTNLEWGIVTEVDLLFGTRDVDLAWAQLIQRQIQRVGQARGIELGLANLAGVAWHVTSSDALTIYQRAGGSRGSFEGPIQRALGS